MIISIPALFALFALVVLFAFAYFAVPIALSAFAYKMEPRVPFIPGFLNPDVQGPDFQQQAEHKVQSWFQEIVHRHNTSSQRPPLRLTPALVRIFGPQPIREPVTPLPIPRYIDPGFIILYAALLAAKKRFNDFIAENHLAHWVFCRTISCSVDGLALVSDTITPETAVINHVLKNYYKHKRCPHERIQEIERERYQPRGWVGPIANANAKPLHVVEYAPLNINTLSPLPCSEIENDIPLLDSTRVLEFVPSDHCETCRVSSILVELFIDIRECAIRANAFVGVRGQRF